MLIIFYFNQSKNNSIYLYDIINLIWYNSLKLTLPNNTPRTGITKSFTKEVTILLKAVQMIMPIDISNLFPLIANSLMIFILK